MWWKVRCQQRHLVLFHPSCEHQIRDFARRGLTTQQLTKPKPPLRILFCGSDYFSIASLKALHHYSKSTESNVLSIDVATKTDKRTGRGLKNITPPAIKPVARELRLRVHQFDTFTGWQLPHYGSGENASINLIVAVSFGLLVPPRILRACQYGGINVHPSILPDLKGSSPIEHAILYGYTQTGLTVQTLHPSKFDEGEILEQTPAPGIAIPKPDSITAVELSKVLAPLGAEMLLKAIRNKSYLPGSEKLSPYKSLPLRMAPKILPANRQIIFASLSVEQILRMNRAIPKLWVVVKPLVTQTAIRINLGTTLREAEDSDFKGQKEAVMSQTETGTAFAIIRQSDNIQTTRAPLIVRASDGFIAIPDLTVSGSPEGPGAASAGRAQFFRDPVDIGDCRLYVFRTVLP